MQDNGSIRALMKKDGKVKEVQKRHVMKGIYSVRDCSHERVKLFYNNASASMHTN